MIESDPYNSNLEWYLIVVDHVKFIYLLMIVVSIAVFLIVELFIVKFKIFMYRESMSFDCKGASISA